MSGVGVCPSEAKLCLQAVEHLNHRGISSCNVCRQIILMDLSAAHEEGGDARDADAASDVPHEVVDASRITNFFLAQPAHGHGGEGNKDEAASEAIDEVRQGDGSHRNVKIDMTQQQSRVAEDTEATRQAAGGRRYN